MTLLSLRGIAKAFGGRQILRGVDLELPDGAPGSGWWGRTAPASRRCCVSRSVTRNPTQGRSLANAGLRLAMRPGPLGDDRSPTAALRDARADLREIDDGLASATAGWPILRSTATARG